jgi:hypothetical protein
MGLRRFFTKHPASLGETYPEHIRLSLGYAVSLLGAALAAFADAVFPFVFQMTASQAVRRLYERMTKRCLSCPSVRLHRPDLFAAPEAANVARSTARAA